MATIQQNSRRLDKVAFNFAVSLVRGAKDTKLVVDNGGYISIMNMSPCQLGLSVADWIRSNPNDVDWLKRFLENETAD